MLKFIKGLFVAEPEQPAPDNLILFTPNDGSWDVKMVRRLFDAGLGRLHVQYRRDWEVLDYLKFLEALPPEFWPRIVLEEHPQLVTERKLGGLQIHPTHRAPRQWPRSAKLSAKCHSFDELCQTDKNCAYVFLTPLFDSISKKDYRPRRTPLEHQVIVERWKAQGGCPVFALGGVTAKHIPQVRQLGFDGAAFIGAVWKSDHPVRAFLEIERAWSGKSMRPLKRKY